MDNYKESKGKKALKKKDIIYKKLIWGDYKDRTEWEQLKKDYDNIIEEIRALGYKILVDFDVDDLIYGYNNSQ